MQLSPGVLRTKIKMAPKKQKNSYLKALLWRDVALLAFAIFYIATFVKLFGDVNSSVAVSSFCMLLGIRFVNYGYQLSDSIFALGGVLLIMLLGSMFFQYLPLPWFFIAHSLSLLFILMTTTAQPTFGNGGLYTFSYIFITGNPVSASQFSNRLVAMALVWFLLAVVLWRNHHQQPLKRRLHHVLTNFSWHSDTSHWQLRLALGVSTALTVAQLLQLHRAVWLGFACMSILLPQNPHYAKRVGARLTGVIIGSSLFIISLALVPDAWAFILAPLAGFGLGLTDNYFYHSVLNCFGALSIATSLFGTVPAGELRIFNNFLGILVAVIFIIGFKLLNHYFLTTNHFTAQNNNSSLPD